MGRYIPRRKTKTISIYPEKFLTYWEGKMEGKETHIANKTINMPLSSQRLYHNLSHRFPTPLALG
jgi:hypothetical protein